jgi:hypothetical protein
LTNGSPNWTRIEDEQLRKLASAGTTAIAIAGILKRTVPAVRNRSYRLKILLADARIQGVSLKATK